MNKIILMASLLIASLSFSSFDDFDYDQAWKEVQEHIKNGLPKSALGKVEEIYSIAFEESNDQQYIKATIFKTKLVLNTEELGLEKVVSSLEESIEKAKAPSKQILHSLAAQIFQQYLSNQYYAISQRTVLESFETGDIRTWAPNNYKDYIANHYLLSVDEISKNFKTSDFKQLLTDNKRAEISLRPRLYDLLVDRAIAYFSTRDYLGITPSFSFKLDSPEYFSSVEDFIALQIESEDEDSKLLRAVTLYQEVLKDHFDNNELKVLSSYDLSRLDFVLAHGSVNKANQKLEEAIEKAIQNYASPYNHSFILRLAQLKLNDKKYQEALEVLKQLDGQKLEEHIDGQRKNIISNINQKNLQVNAEKVVSAESNFLVHITSRNVENVHFKLVKITRNQLTDLARLKRELKRDYVEGLPVHKQWNRSGIRDGYKSTSFEEIIDGLDLGEYLLVLGSKEKFTDGESAYLYSHFVVSNIAYSSYDEIDGKKILVRNRQSGEPISKAKVSVMTRSYNNQTRNYKKTLAQEGRTDKNGWFKVNQLSENSYTYHISKDDDHLILDRYDYLYNNRRSNKSYDRNEIFTDRAIYRPGQTVHFKTLSLFFDKNRIPSISPFKDVEIDLLDANGQEVEKLNLKANEFGSSWGSFTLPAGGLTGMFTLSTSVGSKAIRVEEYKRPKFKVEIDTIENEVKLGDIVEVNGSAMGLSGAPVSNGNVTYTVMRNSYYGWWSWYRRVPSSSEMIKQGTMNTNGSGLFALDFLAQPDSNADLSKNPTYSYTITINVTNGAGETRNATKVISIASRPYAFNYQVKEISDVTELKTVKILATTTEQKNVNATAKIKVIELIQPDKWKKPRRWNEPTNPIFDRRTFEGKIDRIGYEEKSALEEYPEKEVVFEQVISISEEGYNLDLSKIVEGGCAYKIELESTEEYSGFKVNEKGFFAVTNHKSNKYPVLNLLYTNKLTAAPQVGEKFEVQLGTPDKEVVVYYSFIRDREIVKKGLADVDNDFLICYEPTEKDRGGITLSIDYVKHNYYGQEVIQVNLPWTNKDLKVELVTNRDKVLPGSQEEWTMKVSGPKKDKVLREVLATMYDASLDQFIGHNYTFNPYPNRYGNVSVQFFGFENAGFSDLNYKWNRWKSERFSRPALPTLKGLEYGFGGIRIRGSRSTATEIYTDGIGVKSKRSAPLPASADMADAEMAEASGVMNVKEESADYDTYEESSNQDSGNENTQNEIPIRKNLAESVFFYPNLKTDAEGNLIFKFTMNEALTTWKLLTFAHDKDLRYGMTSHEVKTQKDLMIIPNAPRFFREGDRIKFPATLSNLSDKDLSVHLNMEFLDPETNQVITKDIDGIFVKIPKLLAQVPKGESMRIEWSLAIPKNYKKLMKYRVTAQTNNHRDGEENIIPVVTNQVLVTESKVISLKGQEEEVFTFDELMKKTSTSQPHRYTFEYTSNPVWYAVQALPYLMEYPHQCTEQIFNRMYANTMASHIANSNAKLKAVFEMWKSKDSDALVSNLEKNEELKSAILTETPWVRNAKSETEQKKRIALLFDLNKMALETNSVLTELQRRQMPSGGFPWFTGGRDNVYITQNVVEGLAHLQHLGMLGNNGGVHQNILNRALVYMDEMLNKRYQKLKARINQYGGSLDNDHLDRLSIHYLYVQSFFQNREVLQSAKEAYDYYMGQAKKYWLGKGLYSEAMLGLTLYRASDKTYQSISKSLMERSFFSEDLGRYWNIGNGFNWHELPIESHAMLIEFFTETSSNRDDVEDMKIWLLKNKQTNHWKTTKATSAAIYALLNHGEEGMISWIEDQNDPDIKIGNEVLNISEMNAEAGTGYIKKTWLGDQITEDKGSIQIKNNNDVISWGAGYYQYFEDIDRVEDFNSTPLKITRNLFVEEMTDAGPQLVAFDKNGVHSGDRIIVRLEIKVDRNMSYVHLKDMRSSAFEPENVLSGYRWKAGLGYYESTRDLASHFFITHLNKGTYVFEYPMRAVYKGEFTGGMATIQCMYAPEFMGHSKGDRVVVD